MFDQTQNLYTNALNNAISTFDEDLAQLIVLSGLSKNANTVKRTFSLASHLQNIRALEQEFMSLTDVAIIEATNKQLVLVYRDYEGFVN